MTIIVLDKCREAKLRLSDFVIQNLVIHIALSIRRIAEGFKIAKLNEKIDILNKKLEDFDVFKYKIINRYKKSQKTKNPTKKLKILNIY